MGASPSIAWPRRITVPADDRLRELEVGVPHFGLRLADSEVVLIVRLLDPIDTSTPETLPPPLRRRRQLVAPRQYAIVARDGSFTHVLERDGSIGHDYALASEIE